MSGAVTGRFPAAAKEQAEGRALQEAIRAILRGLPDTLFKDRSEFERALDAAARKAGLKVTASARKAILSALSEGDETAEVCRGADGNPEPDPELRDTESVPLPAGDDPVDPVGVPASVRAFFEREVKPHVPDAWIDTGRRDPKDGRVGLIGYEINFNRYFYRYTPPRPLEEIEAARHAALSGRDRMNAKANLAASVAARLLNRARETGEHYETLFASYCLERQGQDGRDYPLCGDHP